MNILTFIWEGCKLAWQAVNGKRTRTFLTTLGVATGIFTISGILTLVNSMQDSMNETLNETIGDEDDKTTRPRKDWSAQRPEPGQSAPDASEDADKAP